MSDIIGRLSAIAESAPSERRFLLETADELKRLQELLRNVGANRYWESRWRDAQAEIERLRADKDVQRSQDRNAAYEAEIEQLRKELHHYLALEMSFHAANKLIEQHEDEIERLRSKLIDAEYGKIT